ncbi:hypothetical protein KIPB_016935, partial [Kipferlia bialata]
VFRSFDYDDLLMLDTLPKILFVCVGAPIALLSGFRGWFLLVSMSIFGYLNVEPFLRRAKNPTASPLKRCLPLFWRLFSRYITVFPVLFILQSTQ